MHGKNIIFSVLLIGVFLSSGIAKAQEIGAVLAGTRGSFWKAMEEGIVQGGKDFDVTVWTRSPVDDDPKSVEENSQQKMIQYLLNSGIKGLVLAPIPINSAIKPIEIPIPTVFVDRGSNDFKALSTITTDNYAAGRAAAQSLQGYLSKGAKVAVLRLAPHVVSTTAREQGFIDAAHDMGLTIGVDVYLGHDLHQAEAAAIAALDPHQGRLDAVFTSTTNLALSALRVLHEWPQDKRPRLVGFDYRPGFEEALRNGELHAIMVQDPFQMGYRAVQQLVQARSGQTIAERTPVDVLVVTGRNVDDPKIREALSRLRD